MDIQTYAMRLLRIRPRSAYEMRMRLKQKGFIDDEVTAEIERLKLLGHLDDRQFARFWVKERELGASTGVRRMRHELEAKGISDTVADEALSDFTSRADEYAIAKAFAEKRLKYLTGLENVVKRRRLSSALIRKGFAYDTIDRLLKELIKEDDP